MKTNKLAAAFIILGFGFAGLLPLFSQAKGMSSISAEDMKSHLRFLGAREFEGRNVPSVGLNVASKYIALVAEKCGLKPVLPGNSYFQELPLEVCTLSPSRSYLRLTTETGEQTFLFPEAFGLNMRTATPGTVSGEPVFLGYGLRAPESNWDDYGEIDLKGKIVVILDADLPRDHVLKPAQNRISLMLRARAAKERGAFGVITVIGQEREKNLAARGLNFDRSERVKFLDIDLDQQMVSSPAAAGGPFLQVDVRHDVAAMILGTSREDLDKMFEAISGGKPVSRRELPGKTLEIKIALAKRRDTTENVVGYIEGTDSRLKKEYIVIGSHHDHLGKREERIYPGVWFFCGTTEDYHQETDLVEKCDFQKMEKVTRLVYLVAWDIGHKPSLLKLDINPEITMRGKQNLKFNWLKASSSTAIRNVRLFDGERVLEGATVIFKGGKIESAGAAVPIPEGAEVIDGSGKTLLPGLIDSHTHIFGNGLEQSLVFGVTTDIDMFTDVKFMQAVKKEQASGGAPNKSEMISPGTLVTAPGGHGTQYGLPIPTIRSPQEAQAFVDARIAEGSDFIKIIYGQIAPNSPMIDKDTLTAVIAAAHKRGKMAVVHVTNYKRALEAVPAGADGLAHVFADELPEDGIGSLVEKGHFFLIPTLSVIKSLCGLTQDEAFLKDKSLEPYLSPADLARLNQTFPSAGPAPYKYAVAEEAVRKLKAKKVPILAGTDAPNPGTLYGTSLHEELNLLVKAGLKPIEVLAAATSLPAATFGLKDRGRVAAGLRADLVLVNGNPLEDIKATRNIEAIWKGGMRVDRAAYQKEIEKQKAAAQTPPSPALQAKLNAGLISDFEDGTSSARFGAGWAISTDSYAGGKSKAEMKVVADGADKTGKSLLVTGEVAPGLPYAWSGVIFFPGEVPFAPVDLSSKKEIVFWAKGDGKACRLLINTRSKGYTPASQIFKLEKEWKRYDFSLSDFGGADAHEVTAISFAAGPAPGTFSFQVDEIALK